MNTPPDPRSLLHEIPSIERMERGKLSILRQGRDGPYYNLQRWEDGRNVTEYVPRDQVPLLEEHIAAHQQFERLVGEYERLITEATRLERRSGVKKTPGPNIAIWRGSCAWREPMNPVSAKLASTWPRSEASKSASGQIQRVIGRVGKGAALWQQKERAPQPCDAPVLYISADATGVPMRRELLAARKGKASDGSAKTRMAMLGCVFTQHALDEEGRPIRDHDSTTYLAAFQSPSDFGISLRREAIGRGLFSAPQSVLLIDGASGLEKLGRDYFPGAVQIVDFYHAMEHLEELIAILLGKHDPQRLGRRRRHWKKLLLHDGLERIIARARTEACECGKVAEVESALGYFLNNREPMRYGAFRKLGYFIGSGVIEAGCRSVIGQRCKQSGMFWSEPGASKVLALRCISASRRLASFWKDRLNARAALNDPLPLVA